MPHTLSTVAKKKSCARVQAGSKKEMLVQGDARDNAHQEGNRRAW
jgi:hypothetical protein